MARPRTLGDEQVIVPIRMAKTLHEQFQTAADGDKRSLSDWIRVTCEKAITPPPAKPPARARRSQ